ncbi:KH domain-containing protein [Zea mays]|uniref:KH domain-containing protein n=1 Tax=Zea mays TaxID=4577 RepID=A0A1D6PX70_MAIZE|nr:KH domain-containing protein [Zea mays]
MDSYYSWLYVFLRCLLFTSLFGFLHGFLYRHFQGIQTSLADMVHKVTALRVKVPLLSGDHVLRIMAMDTHLEVCLHLKTTTHPTAATRRSRDHQEVAWAGTRGRALHPILRTRVVLLITTSRDLSHMIASHRATLLGQGITTVMVNHRVLTMANLNTRNMRLSRTTAMGMVILDTMLPLRTSSTMVSRQWARSKAILNSQIPMLGLHTVDLVNGLPGVLRLQMALTRRQLHLMGRLLSTLLLMGKRTVQQLDLMDMLNRVTHSRVGRHQLHMVRVHQQLQAILSSKVAMHSTHRPNQPPADPNYGSAYPQPGYGPPGQATGQAGYASSAASQPAYGQAGYTQPPTNPPGYEQSAAPATTQSGYAAPPANPQQPAAAKGVSPQPGGGAAAYGAGGQWTA